MTKTPAAGARGDRRAACGHHLAAEKGGTPVNGLAAWSTGAGPPSRLSRLLGGHLGKGQEVIHWQGRSCGEQVASQRAAGQGRAWLFLQRLQECGEQLHLTGQRLLKGAGPAAVPGFDLLHLQAGQLLEDAPGGQAQAVLLGLAFEQAVSQQGDQVDQQHGLDALVGVNMQGTHFQVLLADFETFLHGILLAVEGQHFRIGQVEVIGDQEKPSVAALGGLQGIGVDPALQAELPFGRGAHLHADQLADRGALQLGGHSLADFLLTAIAFLPDLASDLFQRQQQFAQVLVALLPQGLLHGIGAHHQAPVAEGATVVGEGHFTRHAPVAFGQGEPLKIPLVWF